ncbi:MAG: hypothetical protein JWM58_2630 [Rhizobium sp.]|nr:hypothetical protein [Rhizobium sp.]
MTPSDFAALALSLPDAVESAHFGKRDFRAAGRIFATLPTETKAALKLTPDQQLMMMELYPGLFEPIANAWGARGWTHMDVAAATPEIAASALRMAWGNVMSK